MSAAARPKHWGVSRQAKDREFDPTKVEVSIIQDNFDKRDKKKHR
jgi:hypothetical protein